MPSDTPSRGAGDKAASIIPPGATIGIIGGGQLGRMTALAAAELGYRTHVFCPEGDAPAVHVTDRATRAPYTDMGALARFAESVDVATFEFENIPHEPVKVLAEHVPVRPGWTALKTAQDRALEKAFVQSLGIGTAAFREARTADDVRHAVAEIGFPAIVKTCRLGYDGKGQARIEREADIGAAWAALGTDHAIVEAVVDFACEISVIVARGLDGREAIFDVTENRHVDHILDTTIVPARVSPAVLEVAADIAGRIAAALDLVGLLAAEMFVTRSGEVLVNEIAPRPHNSGHWTLDACETSQFEQLVRAITGLPLGSTRRFADAEMKNLIGEAVNKWVEFVSEPGVKVHLYGKAEARPGRKMGHVTRLLPSTGGDGGSRPGTGRDRASGPQDR
jgi:5-(carboxyamino)imidazole ribonucleotide synthase